MTARRKPRPFSEAEVQLLTSRHEQFGSKWVQILSLGGFEEGRTGVLRPQP